MTMGMKEGSFGAILETGDHRYHFCAPGFRTETMAIGSMLCGFQVTCAKIKCLESDHLIERRQNQRGKPR